jgi:DNA-binding CsgD family transcriptional regulator
LISSGADNAMTICLPSFVVADSVLFRDQWSLRGKAKSCCWAWRKTKTCFWRPFVPERLDTLLKDASAGDVIAAVRAISRGEAVCTPRLCMGLIKWMSVKSRDELSPRMDTKPNLTLRQMQLVTLVAEGMTNKEIASQLSLTKFTVKNRLYRIMRQADAETGYEAVESVRAQLEDGG